MGDHTAVAVLGMDDPDLVAAVLSDWRSAPIDERLRAMLGYLEKVTLTPNDIGAEDAAQLEAAGVSNKAVQEALYVCFIFNIMDRLADAFDFYLPSEQGHKKTGKMLHKMGYGIASIPG